MCGRHEEAVKKYQSISPLIEYSDILGLAVALYKMEDFSASYQAYEQALQLASNEADKSEILSAMGMVAYKSGNTEQAKTLLFKSCQLSSPSVDGLFALCSLGLVLGDVTLATAAITELQKWQDKEEGETIAVDLGFLSAMIYALQGHNDLACRQVAKLLKRHSHRGELWNLSAELTLQLSPNQAQ
ncbi:tetratricopeptide repeat protein 37-like, partial [Amphiura filiformis]|uniref:tetratricopeptide repeat protein 37-like n=1 Tax=Amphiura filiformis TaxID=82378 RepID=UPI003B20CCA8